VERGLSSEPHESSSHSYWLGSSTPATDDSRSFDRICPQLRRTGPARTECAMQETTTTPLLLCAQHENVLPMLFSIEEDGRLFQLFFEPLILSSLAFHVRERECGGTCKTCIYEMGCVCFGPFMNSGFFMAAFELKMSFLHVAYN
jgi:hypothetical protein